MTAPATNNVVLVTVDSLRADALGGADSVSPVLDSLAESGVVFENAVAQGNWTPFSFPSIHGSRPVFAESDDIGLASTPTLAEQVSDAGIETAGFNAANGFLTDHWGYDRGFDEFEPFVDSGGYSKYLAAHPTIQAWVQLGTSPFRRAATVLSGGSDERPFADVSRMGDLEDRATEFLATTDGPFFLWVHYMDTHTPYVPAPRHIREVSDNHFGVLRMLTSHLRTGLGWEVDDRTLETLRTLYEATVRQVDASVGRLLDTLETEAIAMIRPSSSPATTARSSSNTAISLTTPSSIGSSSTFPTSSRHRTARASRSRRRSASTRSRRRCAICCRSRRRRSGTERPSPRRSTARTSRTAAPSSPQRSGARA